MKRLRIYTVLLLSLSIFGCNDDPGGTFGTMLYFSGDVKRSEIAFKENTVDQTSELSVALAQPQAFDVTYNYSVDELNVAKFNRIYGDSAVILPAEFYELDNTPKTIGAGKVDSEITNVNFKNFKNMDREIRYVLPISVNSTDIALLKSDETRYHVFVAASLITTTPDMTWSYALPTWTNPTPLENLTSFTLEALIRVKDFSSVNQSIMGIETLGLFRMGTGSYLKGQVHFVSGSDFVPIKDETPGVYEPLTETWEWTHVAVTREAGNESMVRIYLNGVEKWSGKALGDDNDGVNQVPITFSNPGTYTFHIGRAKNYNNRYLAGNISECRIWNVARTQQEIKDNPYRVETDSPGLVAYWKFDEGSGSKIKDHVNDNDATVYFFDNFSDPKTTTEKAPVWDMVSVPETN